ncbi:hypothetical protein PINS_up001698 [Pythium insidiosum]|nr:hypothetical protein PINS_up001698 [Pythium insidiosum]
MKQGQVSALSTKLESLKKKMQELKASSLARDVLFATERAKTAKLEAMLVQYENHFEACKFSLNDKEKTMSELKSSNRILENFRSVLHHRVENLEVAKAPMRDHMSMLETTIHDMQTELADEYQMKAMIQQDVEHKDSKIKVLLHEVKMLRQNMLKKEYAMSEMIRELTRIAQMGNAKDIEAAVKDAYKQFVIGEPSAKKPSKLATPISLSHVASPDKDASKSPGKRHPKEASVTPSKTAAATSSSQQKSKQLADSTSGHDGIDEDLGYDSKHAVDEANRQMEHMSKTITTLRTALENTNIKADRIRRDAVAEGSMLIEECNKLRKENKQLLMRIRELEHQIFAQSQREAARSPMVSTRNGQKRASSPVVMPSEARAENAESPCKLAPLSIGMGPHKQAVRASTPGQSPLKRQNHSTSPLPFAKLEMERARRVGANGKDNDLQEIIQRQKKDIQRLQMQVQLLLSDEKPTGKPIGQKLLETGCIIDLMHGLAGGEPVQSVQELNDTPARARSATGRTGTLRSLNLQSKPQPHASSPTLHGESSSSDLM